MPQRGNRGFIKAIVILIIALIVLGFLGYNLREIFELPDVRDNFRYAFAIAGKLLNFLVVEPALWILEKLSAFRGS